MLVNKEKRLANKIKKILEERGFKIEIQKARKTKSIYIKLDNGACDSIRISNHISIKNNCKYYLVRNYKGKRKSFYNGQIKRYYNYNNIGRLITDIETERFEKIIKNGYSNYKMIRNKENKELKYNQKVA